jgi:hypothetical protein
MRVAWEVRNKRRACVGLAVVMLASAAQSGTPARDKAWQALIEQAKAHGGVETKLDQSSSFVFQLPDGAYVTLTHMFKGGRRAACLVSKDQNATACFDWDNGKTSFAERKDVASPWVRKTASNPGDDEDKPSLLAQLLASFGDYLHALGKYRVDRFGNITFYSN